MSYGRDLGKMITALVVLAAAGGAGLVGLAWLIAKAL